MVLQIMQKQSAFHGVSTCWICKYSSFHRNKRKHVMNRTPITSIAFLDSQSGNAEVLAAIHEGAKQRAQALRREAVSVLIDDFLAWLLRKPTAVYRPNASQTHCVSSAH
jgi:hypothetical protein